MKLLTLSSRALLLCAACLLPFTGLLKASNPTGETSSKDYNQVASVFARVAPRGAGIEAYGELYREDHNVDFRDLVGEPDHQSAYTLGVRRAWLRADSVLSAFTFEVQNSRVSHLVRVRERGVLQGV